MSKQFAITITLLVVVPVVAFLALGKRMIDGEQDVVRQRLKDLLAKNLTEVDRTISVYFSQQQRKLDVVVAGLRTDADFRKAQREQPLIQQLVLLDNDGAILFPNLGEPLSEREQKFLMRMERVLLDKDILVAAGGADLNTAGNTAGFQSSSKQALQQSLQQSQPPAQLRGKQSDLKTPPQTTNITPTSGWFTWFWGKGVQLVHWSRRDDGQVVAVCMPRARWTADLIERLPETRPQFVSGSARLAQESSLVRLVDSEERVIYQWGRYEIASDTAPLASVDLSSPLSSWRLQHFGPKEILDAGGRAATTNLIIASAILCVSLLGLALILTRELTRRLREATQRVNFVNQVSHELRTPLTNIRMYAELLATDLDRLNDDEDDNTARRHLNVIADESTRLSRLITNVLTFARKQRSALSIRCRDVVIDDVIQSVVEQFRPSLTRLDIDVALDLDASAPFCGDNDAIGQILGNLIGNVEKYAADGKSIVIKSRQSDGNRIVQIDVVDYGPGIEPKYRDAIFEPFKRVSDRIESATGTGIGLAISRELARLHGGALEIVDSAHGAHFRLTIRSHSSDVSQTESSQ
ncbi:MAG: HAMP domain-containing histidine kinase [Planctomycetales bacterium]|nr:HAMP domain-containing histidine kinase [Planctomycetales bacterium]